MKPDHNQKRGASCATVGHNPILGRGFCIENASIRPKSNVNFEGKL